MQVLSIVVYHLLTSIANSEINLNLLNSKRTGSEVGPSPRIFVAYTVIKIMLVELEHAEGISSTWLHCPLIQVVAETTTVCESDVTE